jgi:hypothetical protein
MVGPNVGGPSQTDGQPIRMTGEQVGGKGADGNFHIFSTDNFGALNVNTSGGGGGSNVNLIQVAGAAIALGQTVMANSLPVTIASNQSAIPVSGTVTSNQGTPNTIPNSWPVEVTDGTNILGTSAHPLRIDPTGTTVQPVSGTVAISGTSAFNLTQWAGTVLGTPTNYGTSPGAVIAGSVNAFVTNTVATTLASTTITGTVAVTQSTSPWVVSLTSTTVTGTVTTAGNKTNNNAAPGATNSGSLPAIANAATQTWTEGNLVFESVDLSGRQRIRGTLTTNNAAPSSDGQQAITCVANAAAPSYTEGNLVLHSVDLSGNTRIIGTRTNNNAAPSFQVGVLSAVANAANQTWTEGNQVLLSTDLSGNLRVTTAGTSSSTSNAPAQQAVGTASVAILASNTARKEATIVNTGTTVIFLGLGQTPTNTAYHIALSACSVANDGTGGTYTTDLWTGAINAIGSAVSGTVVAVELT